MGNTMELDQLSARQDSLYTDAKEMSFKTTARDDTVVDEYFANSKNQIYMCELTLRDLTALTQLKPIAACQNLLDKDKWNVYESSLEEYVKLGWMQWHTNSAHYFMHKAALIGSDIYKNGQLAPLQFQMGYDPNKDQIEVRPHPGSDRLHVLLNLIKQGVIEDKVVCQFEVFPWTTLEQMTNGASTDWECTLVESKAQLQTYYKNWDESQYYNVAWHPTLEDESISDYGFMRHFIKGIQRFAKHHEGIVPEDWDNRHLEIKALGFRYQMRDSLEKFITTSAVDWNRFKDVKFGPWNVSLKHEHPQLKFHPDDAW